MLQVRARPRRVGQDGATAKDRKIRNEKANRTSRLRRLNIKGAASSALLTVQFLFAVFCGSPAAVMAPALLADATVDGRSALINERRRALVTGESGDHRRVCSLQARHESVALPSPSWRRILAQDEDRAMDDFERELRIGNLEQSYEIATAALRRAQVELQMLRADRRAAPTLIEKTERRCQELARRRRALRHVLDELEDEGRRSVSGRHSTPELRPR
jgi:hypothetical protein